MWSNNNTKCHLTTQTLQTHLDCSPSKHNIFFISWPAKSINSGILAVPANDSHRQLSVCFSKVLY